MLEIVINSFLCSNSILRSMLGHGSYFIMIPILQNEKLKLDRIHHGHLPKITQLLSGRGRICTPECVHTLSLHDIGDRIWNLKCLYNFIFIWLSGQVSSVQSLSRVQLFATPWIAARQASLSITNSWSSSKLMCIESVMASSHHILCRPLLLLPPIPPRIRVFSHESTLQMRWPSIGVSALTSVLPMNTQDWSPLGWIGWISLQSKGLSRVFSNTTVQKHQFFGAQLSSQSNSHIHTWPLEKP